MKLILDDIKQKIITQRRVLIGVSGCAIHIKDKLIPMDDEHECYEEITAEHDYPITHHI